MEVNFRLILIIISVVAICGIYINGRYKIRKGEKNPYKLKAKPLPPEDTQESEERLYDVDGFDQDGIRRVKTIVDDQPDPFEMDSDIPVPPTVSSGEAVKQTASLQDIEEFKENFTPVADDLDFHNEPAFNAQCDDQIRIDTASEPVITANTEPSPENAVTKKAKEPESKLAKIKNAATKKTKLKRDQLDLNFEEQPPQKMDIEQEVLALSVMCPNNMSINGAALLPQLLTLGLKFGDMNIFHRHKDNAGNGPIHFSLANMVNPGTFDLNTMEHFHTQGLTLFMTLPNAGEPTKVFQLMLSAAKQLANEFGGQVLDSKRSVMTAQTEQHYISKIREFDRRSRLAQF